jgi:protoheme IX farnesyltransferase
MIKPYLLVTKPGIIFGNMVSVIGGFLLAAKGNIDPMLLLATLAGVSFVIASGCVFNNYIDRDIDSMMERTKNRPLVQGQISSGVSLGYASLLGALGFLVLYRQTNVLATMVAVAGFIIYVGLYSLYLKRKSVYGTLIGSLSGATPPVIGYCAVTGRFDAGAIILLLIFSLWQMPHSYAIAIFRFKDYQTASIPVLPIAKGIATAKKHIIFYVVAFTIATLMLTISGYTGYRYFIVAFFISAYWLWLVVANRRQDSDAMWAKRLFLFSILAITTLSVMMSIDFIPAEINLINL